MVPKTQTLYTQYTLRLVSRCLHALTMYIPRLSTSRQPSICGASRLVRDGELLLNAGSYVVKIFSNNTDEYSVNHSSVMVDYVPDLKPVSPLLYFPARTKI